MALQALSARVKQENLTDKTDVMALPALLGQAITGINAEILEAGKTNDDYHGMGTTLVAGLFLGSRLFYAHVGDSRLYRLRAGRLRCLTRDHSLLQEVVDNGLFENRQQARAAGVNSSVLTRCLGVEADIEVDIGDAFVEKNDLYLFCSDGLNGFLSDAEITQFLRSSEQSLTDVAGQLINAVLDKSGNDNITLILFRP